MKCRFEGKTMKYILHSTSAHLDENLLMLRRKLGTDGYGAWWILLEIVAVRVEEGGEPSIQIPVKTLANLLGKNCRSLPKLLIALVDCSLIECRIGSAEIGAQTGNNWETIRKQLENNCETFVDSLAYLSIVNFSKYKGKFNCYKTNKTREEKKREEKKESFFSSPKGREKKDSNLPYSPTLGENAAGGPALGGAPPPLSPAGGCSSHPQSDTRELSTVEREAAFKKAKAKAIYLRQEGRSLEYVRQILIADYWRTRKLSGDECKKIMEHIQDIQPGSVSSQVTPRSLGTNPRALGTNPRAMGTNPRALGENPRARDQSE
jgi:hypothetical protein